MEAAQGSHVRSRNRRLAGRRLYSEAEPPLWRRAPLDYLCDKNAVPHNPVSGVKRPPIEGYEGKSTALGDH